MPRYIGLVDDMFINDPNIVEEDVHLLMDCLLNLNESSSANSEIQRCPESSIDAEHHTYSQRDETMVSTNSISNCQEFSDKKKQLFFQESFESMHTSIYGSSLNIDSINMKSDKCSSPRIGDKFITSDDTLPSLSTSRGHQMKELACIPSQSIPKQKEIIPYRYREAKHEESSYEETKFAEFSTRDTNLSPAITRWKTEEPDMSPQDTTSQSVSKGKGKARKSIDKKAKKAKVAARKCKVPGCIKRAQTGCLCIAHGGGRPCKHEGCTGKSQYRGLCKKHGGGLRCNVPECNKFCQSKGVCRAHGGGKKCTKLDCLKWAQKRGFCSKHYTIELEKSES